MAAAVGSEAGGHGRCSPPLTPPGHTPRSQKGPWVRAGDLGLARPFSLDVRRLAHFRDRLVGCVCHARQEGGASRTARCQDKTGPRPGEADAAD